MIDLAAHAERLRTGRTPYVLATVVRAERPTSAKAGDRAIVLPDGTLEGFVGGTCAESTVRVQALRTLSSGESTLLRISPRPEETPAGSAEGLVSVGNPCLSGGTLDIFLEAVIPPVLVHVFGQAPVARSLVEVGTAAGFAMHRADGPADAIAPDTAAVLVASHGRDEEQVLAAALRAGVPYIGLIAGRRRGAAVTAALEGGDRIRTPAGLDIGARTAPEIALSVMAEILSVRPRPSPAPRAPVVAEPATAEATDPVCGMTVLTGTALRTEHAGRTWHFCGPGCLQAFADAPERYADAG
jgi:xanthine dehydrogenase accessory factor